MKNVNKEFHCYHLACYNALPLQITIAVDRIVWYWSSCKHRNVAKAKERHTSSKQAYFEPRAHPILQPVEIQQMKSGEGVRWGWNNWTKRDQRSARVCGLGRPDRAWNLRATELTVICMLSTSDSRSCLHLHTVVYSAPIRAPTPLWGLGLIFGGPKALQQHLGSPLPRIPSPWQPGIIKHCIEKSTVNCNLKQQKHAPL